jgi:coproporphyrinogen III oxidase-like Fe-S oxidoreductase
MLGLRKRDGVDLMHLQEDFGAAVLAEIITAVCASWPEGLVEMDDKRLTLSDPDGMLVSTELISTLLARVSSLHIP